MLTLLSDDFSAFPFAAKIECAIKEGRDAILLVPEQLALATETAVAERFPASAPFTFEVSNFSRLADRVFRKKGGLSFRYADRAAEVILMWQAIEATAPLLLSKKRGAADTVKESLALLSELTTAGVTSEELRVTASRLPDSRQSLKQKLSDLAILVDAYEGELHQGYGSLAADLDKLLDALQREPLFANTEIYVSGFTSFTAGEYRVLAEIMRRGPLFVSLPLPDADAPSSAYLEVSDTRARLERIAKDLGCLSLPLPPLHRERPAMLEYAKRMLFREDGRVLPYPEKADGAISFILAKDPYEGCAHVAAEIARGVRSGARYRDFTVLAREPEKYDGVLDDALASEGIPYFFSKNTDIHELALPKMLLAALTAVERGFPRDEVIAYLKCGFTGVTPDEADLFEIYTESWRLKGAALASDLPFDAKPDGFVIYRTASEEAAAEARLSQLNDVRVRVLSPLWALAPATAGEKTATEHATALYRFLVALDAERTLHARAREASLAGRTAEADRLQKIFGVICDLLDRIVTILGDTPISRARLIELLSLLFSSVSLGTIPMLQDAVTVMSADTYRPTGEATVFLLGANEGEFPAGVSLGGPFPEEERSALEEHGLSVGKPPEMRAAREQFSFLRALAAPTARAVVIAYESGAMGESLRPSSVYRRLHYERTPEEEKKGDYPASLFPDVKEETGVPEVYAERAALERYFEKNGTPEGDAIRALLAGTPLLARLDALFTSPLFDPASAVSAENAALLFPQEMHTSQSAIDAYLDCPFAYYCRYVLRLSEDEPKTVKSREVGTIMHAVLESFFQTMEERKQKGDPITKEQIPALVSEAARRYTKKLCPSSQLASPRLSHLLSRVRRAAELVCRDLYEEFSAIRFEPRFCELSLSAKNGPGRFVFTDKEREGAPSVAFSGVIDRVDVFVPREGEKGAGDIYVRVVDYKTGAHEFSREELKKCRNLQMFIYLCAIWKSEKPEFLDAIGVKGDAAIHPAGVMYNTVNPKALTLEGAFTEERLTEKLRGKNLLRHGFFLAEEDVVDAMDDHLAHSPFPRVGGTDEPNLANGKVFGSEVDFGMMLDETETAVLDLARRMRSGCASVSPDTDVNRCPTCVYRTVCRNENFKPKKY